MRPFFVLKPFPHSIRYNTGVLLIRVRQLLRNRFRTRPLVCIYHTLPEIFTPIQGSVCRVCTVTFFRQAHDVTTVHDFACMPYISLRPARGHRSLGHSQGITNMSSPPKSKTHDEFSTPFGVGLVCVLQGGGDSEDNPNLFRVSPIIS